ncbi:MAG TPA: ABC transporter ATP-binding protein [Tepidisphaeraceae bacterium]|nr:ABC transporter ATP-binding protein [Tepidisphaeraceae bacterium]
MTLTAAEASTPALSSTPAARGGPAILCRDVWKQYYFYAHRPRRLKEALIQFITRRTPPAKDAPVWALQDFNLTVDRGETVGVVGHNGAGKSTLLKLLSRILVPTRGAVKINGRLSAIIELGAGFHPDLTARENVFLAASFLGLNRKTTQGLYDKIVDFAELQEHMQTPVKYFSSGMHARLGFAIAVSVDPDVLLIDEVLAVGDARFQPKCVDAIKRFQHDGKAILFVSHAMDQVKSLCQRVIWLKNGKIMAEGDAVATVTEYLEHYWPGSQKKK